MLEKAIEKTLIRMRDTCFEWASNDCGSIMADYVMMFGHPDPMGKYRNSYSNEQEAIKMVGPDGNAEFVDLGMQSIGIKSKDIAVRGDVVVMACLDRELTGLCLGAFCAFKKEARGYSLFKNAKIIKAWSCV